MLRFAGFELDRQRIELRGPDGKAVKLRPQTFDLLALFVANAGRALSKQELQDAVWPNVHVGEDSLFKCIRDLRAALGDDQRQLIKLVSGHGYRFDAEVTTSRAPVAAHTDRRACRPRGAETELAKTRWSRFVRRGPVAFAAVAGLGAVIGLAIAAPMFGPDLIFPRPTSTITVTTMFDASNDSQVAAMAAGVTDRLIDGLAKIENVRVVARPSGASSAELASAPSVPADFVVIGELRKDEQAWTLQARMIKTATKEVQPAVSISVDIKDSDPQLQQSRLAAGVGHQLALRTHAAQFATTDTAQRPKLRLSRPPPPLCKQRASAYGGAGDAEKARRRPQCRPPSRSPRCAARPDGWYSPADSAAAEKSAKSMLERALQSKPGSIPVLEPIAASSTRPTNSSKAWWPAQGHWRSTPGTEWRCIIWA